jgi:hypothetical protein
MVFCELANLHLSANEAVKLILSMVGTMALAVPGINVPALTGRLFDLVCPPQD